MKQWCKRHRTLLLLGCDLVIVLCAYFLAVFLSPGLTLDCAAGAFGRIAAILLALVVHGLVLYFFGVDKSVWRYAQAPEFLLCAFAAGIASLVYFGFDRLLHFADSYPYSFYLVFACFSMMGLVVSRLLYRVIVSRGLSFSGGKKRRTLLVGAGEAAVALIAESRENPNSCG